MTNDYFKRLNTEISAVCWKCGESFKTNQFDIEETNGLCRYCIEEIFTHETI